MSFLVSACFLSLSVIIQRFGVSAAECGSCTATGFNVKNALVDHALEDQRRLKETMVENDPQCFSQCSRNCRCLSFNVCGKTCQLNGGNRFVARHSLLLKPGCRYYDFPKSESICGTQASRPPGICCARMTTPCFNGGSCYVNISDTTRRFACRCHHGFYGDQCEIKNPQTCLDYWTGPLKPISREYTIVDPAGNPYEVFCDFDSEDDMAWTLVASFSWSNEHVTREYGYTVDHPLNENDLDWANFRLSHAAMANIASRSTFWRGTCSYLSYGIDFRDYVRVRLSVFDMTADTGNGCFQIDYLDIKGYSCVNCTSLIFQRNDGVLHLAPSYGHSFGCTYDETKVAYQCPNTIELNRNWGFYHLCADTAFRCTETLASTSEIWLGVSKN